MQKFMIRYMFLSVNWLRAKSAKKRIFEALMIRIARVLGTFKARKAILRGVEVFIKGL